MHLLEYNTWFGQFLVFYINGIIPFVVLDYFATFSCFVIFFIITLFLRIVHVIVVQSFSLLCFSHCINKPLEKAMAAHSSTLAWKIPWMEEPGGLQSMGSLRVRHNWATSLSLFTFMCWRRKWQPSPVFLLGESQGRGSLVRCHLWGCRELDTAEVT